MSTPALETAPDQADRPRRRILIVDDNQEAVLSLELFLQLAGHVVQAARDGSDALARATAFEPAVVLLDIGLPGLDGYEVCRQLRARPGGADLIIIALTGSQEEDEQRSRVARFDHFLVKPVDPAFLRDLLDQRG
jgi:CheY-like chemotaxis protein